MLKKILRTLATSAALVPVALSAQSSDYYRCPLDIPVYLSANFGEIRTNRFHTGIDIKTEGVTGKPLYAAADGFISRVTVAPGGYGRALYISHPNGTMTVYAHMERFTHPIEEYLRTERHRQRRSDIDAYPAADRFPVKKGDPIGLAGNSGSSTGPHLHFEVRRMPSGRALNPMTPGWITTAAGDTTPPRIVRLYHIDVDTVAGVPIHSAPRTHDVRSNPDGSYSLVRTSPLRGGPASYFVVEATDRMDGVANTFGIYRARMSEGGVEKVLFEKEGVLFDDIRYACASVLYPIQRTTRNEAVMLAVKSGNNLPMYKKAVNRGVVSLAPAERRNIEITVEDDAGNAVSLAFAVESEANHTLPERPAGRIATDRGDFRSYEGGMAVFIPKGALYEPIFYTQSTVDIPVRPRADSIRPVSPVYRTGDGAMPLHRSMRVAITADIPERLRPHARLARVSDAGALSFAGGSYSNGTVGGTSRDFGTFCVVVDTIPPVVKPSFGPGADLSGSSSVTITATDNFSGIAYYTGSIDGEWIIFERNASGGRYVHRFDAEKLQTGRTHTFEFSARDNSGNTTLWRGTFFK